MAKYQRKYDLSKEEVEKLLLDFSLALVEIKKPAEAVAFIQDILSEQEAKMLAKRLKIAEHLLDGRTYEEIREILKVAPNTIARVNEWLTMSGEGYRMLISRLKSKRPGETPTRREYGAVDLKRRYPSYYWPELLLEAIARNTNKRQKKQIREALDHMKTKTQLYKQLNKILRQ